ncbi:MAG: porin [Rhodospirillaceae bacterium]
MKKYLLAGTSAFALALTAGAANAQSAPGKFDIKISGDAYFEAGFVSASLDKDTANRSYSSNDFINRFRLEINPEATADNGLKYGAKVRIRANSGDGRVDGDKAYIYLSGAFGSVQGGVTYGPSDVTYVGHPNDFQIVGNYDQWKYYVPSAATGGVSSTAAGRGGVQQFAWGQYGNGSSAGGAAPASDGMQLLHSHDLDTKIVYYTPRFFGKSAATGLQAAVSYAPQVGSALDGGVSVNTSVGRNSNIGAAITDSAGLSQQVLAFRDVYELTANYVETFDKFTVKGSVGYEGGNTMQSSTATVGAATDQTRYNDLQSFQIGAQVGYEIDSVQKVAIGGGYVNNFKSGYRKANLGTQDFSTDQTSWNIGGQYTYGPIVAGVKYLAQKDAGDLLTAGNRTLNSITAGVMYTVAPGLRTGLEYTNFEAKSDLSLDNTANSGSLTTGSKKQTGNIVLVRGVVSF